MSQPEAGPETRSSGAVIDSAGNDGRVTDHLSMDQRKHIASVIDKVAIAYFAVFGYTAYSSKDWILTAHALVMFLVIEAAAVRVLKEHRNGK